MGTEKKGELQERFLKDDPYRIPSQLAWEDELEWVQGNPWRVAGATESGEQKMSSI